jgi:hypothetical protein
MLNMCIESLFGSSWFCFSFFLSCWIIKLYIGFLNWLRNNFILWCNNCNFDCVRFGLDGNCFFHIIMSILFSIKTYYPMFCHWVFFFVNCWNGLHKSNHCLITLRVKFSVITSFNTFKLIWTIFYWICWCFFLNWIFEIS